MTKLRSEKQEEWDRRELAQAPMLKKKSAAHNGAVLDSKEVMIIITSYNSNSRLLKYCT